MMSAQQRVTVMNQRLQEAFNPSQLEIIDDSQQHVGHAGNQAGAGYYTILIQSDHFTGKSRIEAHREIYTVLVDLIPVEIHALQIKIL